MRDRKDWDRSRPLGIDIRGHSKSRRAIPCGRWRGGVRRSPAHAARGRLSLLRAGQCRASVAASAVKARSRLACSAGRRRARLGHRRRDRRSRRDCLRCRNAHRTGIAGFGCGMLHTRGIEGPQASQTPIRHTSELMGQGNPMSRRLTVSASLSDSRVSSLLSFWVPTSR